MFLLVGRRGRLFIFDEFSPTCGVRFPLATVVALSFATFTTLTAYYGGSRLILGSLGAEKLDMQIPEHRELRNVVTEMALASGSAMPQVYVINDAAPNALATGTNERNSAICMTTGLLTLLDREETQGVVAHEMSHIRNHDTLVMILVSVLFGGIAMLADWGQRSAFARAKPPRRRGSALIAIPALLLVAVSPLISRLLAMAVSRQREYFADATAAEFTRNPLGLAQALEKIRDAGRPVNKAIRGTAHLFFSDPIRRRVDERDGKLADLLATHPPIEKRIQLLYQMAGVPYRAVQRLPA